MGVCACAAVAICASKGPTFGELRWNRMGRLVWPADVAASKGNFGYNTCISKNIFERNSVKEYSTIQQDIAWNEIK